MSEAKILFIDRDGTLIEEPSDFQIDTIEKFKLLPDTIPVLLQFKQTGFKFVMVTNQDGLGTEGYPQAKFDLIQKLLLQILNSQGITFEAILICPHFESEHCQCRKPALGMVKDYLANPHWDRKRSLVIGDRQSDLKLAENMGIQGILLSSSQGWKEIAQQHLSLPREGSCMRKTKETEIKAWVRLDGEVESQIHTGIGFFDHMLEQISKHGGFSLKLQVHGDLAVDEHHTIEDTALALGSALKQALGDKIGISRFGFFLPMDEAFAEVSLEVPVRAAIDLSGRSYFKFEGKFNREFVGGLPTEMVPHFFKSLADGLGANLHLKIEGENTHHQVESAFKAVGRSLRTAIQKSGTHDLPSTKGTL